MIILQDLVVKKLKSDKLKIKRKTTEKILQLLQILL